MKQLHLAICLFLMLPVPAQADFPPAAGELALELNTTAQSMSLLANEATELLAMTITSPLQALNPQSGPFGIVFLVQLESTTDVHSEGTLGFLSLDGTTDLTQLYNFGLGPDFNLAFEYTNLDFGLVQGDVHIISGPTCDFNADSTCNLSDIDLMYTQGNLVAGVPVTETNRHFDIVGDDILDPLDITEWLSQTATENGYSSPFQRGDTDGLNSTFPDTRNIDLTDYNTLSSRFDPSSIHGPHLWKHGNFDGDTDIDLADYNFLSTNFNPNGYNTVPAVPEPYSVALGIFGVAIVLGSVSPLRFVAIWRDTT
ncbi:MAG: hypothetical protein CMJ81_04105 [Planctomycetaceae bacterium]|nr:hypothetical protein [Planctomycetaceae bacterium]MBP62748.1 hypothetical protein [Planctomycetaceae bacterium]